MNDHPAALVAPSDIADIAGVSRAAVSNWRRRSRDFPERVGGTPERPLFDRTEVVAWLRATGKTVIDLPAIRAWSTLNLLRDELTAEEMSVVLLALACARKLSAEATTQAPPWLEIEERVPDEGLFGLDLDGASYGVPQWSDLVFDGLEDFAFPEPSAALSAVVKTFRAIDVDDFPAVTDYALEKIAGSQIRKGANNGFVGSRIAQALANLAGPEADGTVYDPACGIGEALIRTLDVKDRSGERGRGPMIRVVGHDIDPKALRAFRQRAYLRGVEVQVDRADVLKRDPEPGLKADVILLEPPFGAKLSDVDLGDRRWRYGVPSSMSAELAWIQHAVAHLGDNGRAYVVTPMKTLHRAGQDAQIRAALVESGCVEAILGLPGKMLPHVSIPLAVWVLCSPGDSANPEMVRFVDGSEVDAPEGEIFRWRSLPPTIDNEPVVGLAHSAEILGVGADLTPSRWVGAKAIDTAEIAADYQHALADTNAGLDAIDAIERPVAGYEPLGSARVMSVGDLMKQGVIEMRPGRIARDATSDYFVARLVEVRDVRDRTIPKVQALTDPRDILTLGTDLTRPGDVLVTTTHTVRALVDDEGWHAFGTGIYRLRVLTDQLDPAYLAAVLPGGWNERFFTGSTIRRARIQDLEVPILSRHEQVEFVDALGGIEDLRQRATELASRATELHVTMLDVLRHSDRRGRD